MEGNEETPMSTSTEALDSPSSEAVGGQAEQARATLTPDRHSRCGFFCQPWCLLLSLTLLLLSLLGSWAVVHLTLGTHAGSPFRVSASYDSRIPQENSATIEPRFTTNCTMGKFLKWLLVNSDAAFFHVHLCVNSIAYYKNWIISQSVKCVLLPTMKYSNALFVFLGLHIWTKYVSHVFRVTKFPASRTCHTRNCTAAVCDC